MLPALVAVFALGDWIAVGRGIRWLEYVCKPAVMLVLLAAAATLDPVSGPQRVWFIAALALCLVGDVLLMLPRDLFVPGLVAFLAGHVAYVGGFIARGLDWPGAVAGLVIVAAADATVGRAILASVRTRHRSLLAPVMAYVAVISAMVVCALATGVWLSAVGSILFFASDAVLAWDRFRGSLGPRGRVAVHVLYHAGQAALVASLVTQ